MKKPSQLAVWALGAAALFPWVYVFAMISALIPSALAGDMDGYLFDPMPIVLPLHFFTIFGTWALIAYFCVYIWRTDYIAQDKRALWTTVLLFGNILVTPYFWYRFVMHGKHAKEGCQN